MQATVAAPMTSYPADLPSDRHERFLRLYATHADNLRVFVRMLVRDPNDCEDIWQSVSLVLWRNFESYDDARPFDRWARGVIVRVVLAHRRTTSKRSAIFSAELCEQALAVFDESPRGRTGYGELQESLERCLKALPSKMAQAVLLRYFQQEGYEAISVQTGGTEISTRKLLSRARSRLADCIRQRLQCAGGAGT